jgi:predicted DNA-binding transcriptional regulator AlpA
MSMAPNTNRPTLAELERLAVLAKLPDNAILCTADAALYRGVGVSTWERERAFGNLPPAVRITSRTLGYRKADLDAWLNARREPKAA